MKNIRTRTFGDDILTLDSETGYSPNPDKEVYSVMYGEYIGDDDAGRHEYNSVNMELFTSMIAACAAFSLRKVATDPSRASGVTTDVLKPETLGDILAGAMGR